MANPSPREVLEAFYPQSMPPGKVILYTTTLKKGNEHTSWCHHLPQADRLCQKFRNTRRVRVSAGLHSEAKALQIARQRRASAQKGSIRGCAASVTALPALWAVIRYGHAAGGVAAPAAIGGPPPGRREALGLIEAVCRRPSIVITTRGAAGGAVYVFWLLRRPWLFELEDEAAAAERRAAGALLGRVQGAVARLAAERGWSLAAANDDAGSLAATFPLPDFATGATARGPRAELEVFPVLPGADRYRRRDFQSLPEPPAADPQPWRAVMVRPASRARERRIFDFPPIADGCSWIRAVRAERTRLSKKQLQAALRLLIWCRAPGAGPHELVHELYRGHPGYDKLAVDRILARELRAAAGPTTCRQAAEQPGVGERHCSKCPHSGCIDSPVELAAAVANDPTRRIPAAAAGAAAAGADSRPAATGPAATAAAPTESGATPAAPAEAGRPRIVITSDRHEVNDQALAALLAAGVELFERRGTLVERLRHPGAAPVLRRVSEARLEELLSRHCEFVIARAGAEPRRVPPPRWTTRGLLARGRWPELPQLEAVPSTHHPPEEEPRMIIADLFDSYGPSPADLKVLERLDRHRRAFGKLRPRDEHQSTVRNRLLGLLYEMEETVCEEGAAAPALAVGWQHVDELEAQFWDGAGESPAEPVPALPRDRHDPRPRSAGSASRPGPRRLDARRRSQEAEGAPPARRPEHQRKAA